MRTNYKIYREHVKDTYTTLEDLQRDIKAVQHNSYDGYTFKGCKDLVLAGCFLCYYYQVIDFYKEQGYKFQNKWCEQAIWNKYARDMEHVIWLLANGHINWE